jgi:hypothetical protein
VRIPGAARAGPLGAPLVYSLADQFAAEVAQLCATVVTDGQWQLFLDQHRPLRHHSSGRPLTGRAADDRAGPANKIRLWMPEVLEDLA